MPRMMRSLTRFGAGVGVGATLSRPLVAVLVRSRLGAPGAPRGGNSRRPAVGPRPRSLLQSLLQLFLLARQTRRASEQPP